MDYYRKSFLWSERERGKALFELLYIMSGIEE
jgi:hypothetical protein